MKIKLNTVELLITKLEKANQLLCEEDIANRKELLLAYVRTGTLSARQQRFARDILSKYKKT